MVNVTNAIIAGIFTLLGAIISALINKYGIPRKFNRKKIILHGIGIDLELSNVSNNKMEEILNAFKIKHKSSIPDLSQIIHNFARDQIHSYEYNNVMITINGDNATYKSNIISKMASDNSVISDGKIIGKGKAVNGFFYFNFKTKNSNNTSWNGVALLYLPEAGPIYGYWMSANTFGSSKFLFGNIYLVR